MSRLDRERLLELEERVSRLEDVLSRVSVEFSDLMDTDRVYAGAAEIEDEDGIGEDVEEGGMSDKEWKTLEAQVTDLPDEQGGGNVCDS